MSSQSRRASTLYHCAIPTPQSKVFAPSSATRLNDSTRDPIQLLLEPICAFDTTTPPPGSTQHTDTQLPHPDMSKQPADSKLGQSVTPKTPRKAKKAVSFEAASASANDESSASDAAAPIEEQEGGPTDEDESESEEAAPTPKPRKGAKAATPKKPRKTATPKEPAATEPKAKPKKPPVGEGFDSYTHSIVVPPKDQWSKFWGAKPVSGDPRPSPKQPSARESMGQTEPPMWENRGFRYKRGSRDTKHNFQVEPDNIDQLPQDKNQEDLLAIPLMDMRLKDKNELTSHKREPVIYCYNKVPKDWNDKQTVKALNDRRYQGIDRVTIDPPWSEIEREYLASLMRDNPDASIWELTELHNDRFKGKDFREATPFGKLSDGRTVESTRYQYTSYKPCYDRGEDPPNVRWRGDPSPEAKALEASGRLVAAFGKPDKALLKEYDNTHDGNDGDDEGGKPKKPAKKKPLNKKKSQAAVEESESEDAFGSPLVRKRHGSEDSGDQERPAKKSKTKVFPPYAEQPALDEDEEDLLVLAGAYNDDDGDDSSSVIFEDDDAEQDEEMGQEDCDDAEQQMVSAALEDSAAEAAQGRLIEQTAIEQTTIVEETHATRQIVVDENYSDEEEAE
ncbi:uncharacterized protein J4E78_006517 [Alternaria triticimaculans]|uniref:uncharacterized protein n=1 Tax=Alternaria triticimaculans TaxID=297637 RepID=UPI0020C1BAD2|nr:uncharacterized protein J4E78_006517 [Alternaria triticimaculans]KAI4656627.1 hypothetical protein J4E78_006517 [Alternaria triticimaculans]